MQPIKKKSHVMAGKGFRFRRVSILTEQKQCLPKADNSFLYMNSSTMKTLKYNKGSLILIFTEQGQLLFRCWPSLLLESSAIMLPSMTFFQDYLKESVLCEFYNLPLHACDMVILSCDNYNFFMENSSFKVFIKTELDPIFFREGMRFHVYYLGYPCHFTIKKIYIDITNESNFQDSLDKVCADVSSLNISDNDSFLDNSISDNSTPFCSTPISKTFIKDVNQFYTMHSKTKVFIEKPKEVQTYSDKIFLQHLGGLKRQISELQKVTSFLLNADLIGTEHSCGIILVGAPGTGKTAIVQAISNEYHIAVIRLDNDMFGSSETEYKCHLEKLHNEIIENSPCIFFLDNIDNLHRNNMDSYTCKESELAGLSTLISDIQKDLRHKVAIIATARDTAAIHSSLRKPGLLEKEIYFEVPSAHDRKEILKKILDQKCHNLNTDEISEIADLSHGFTGIDLKHLCDKADILTLEGLITIENIKEALKDIKPSSMVEFMFEIPNVKWSDIGGMHDVKTAITEMVDWPLKHAEQFKRFGIAPSRGILLYGPPGCSKTMIAKALVSESHLNFISIKGPQLFNKYVGESEKAVSELFRKARSAAPCVLFFDEIDSLTSVRGSISGNSNVSERILTQLLVEIDGVDVLQGVSIIAATNRPDMIDPSFLRPGRFDQRIYVPLPDCITRKEIFEAKLKKMPHTLDIDVCYLADTTEGYTGAEITEICREAAMSAIKEYLKSSSSVVTMLHFLNAVKSVVPRTKKEMLEFYENYKKRHVS